LIGYQERPFAPLDGVLRSIRYDNVKTNGLKRNTYGEG
jgi:hypothetical protein